MRKIIFFTLLILILAACNAPSNTSDDENDVDTKENEEEVTNELEEELEEAEETVPESQVESKDVEIDTAGKTESDKVANKESDVKSKEASGNGSKDKSDNKTTEKNTEKKSDSQHQSVIDLAHQIFEAQKEQNYSFLESHISKGTKVDRNNNILIFEDVTYPHEQDFLTEADLGEIEFRFTHENDNGSVIVGFALVNYEEEMSYVVEFEFVQEDGNWKMNDMDLNK